MRRHPEAQIARRSRGESPLFDEDALRARVERGISYYDALYPGWEEWIDIERLWMDTPTACIKAQVERIFDGHMRRVGNLILFVGVQDLINEHFGRDDSRQSFQYEHGITAGYHPTFWERIEEFDYLERYWKDEIIRRRREKA